MQEKKGEATGNQTKRKSKSEKKRHIEIKKHRKKDIEKERARERKRLRHIETHGEINRKREEIFPQCSH
jgi:hypothetical protein